MQTFKLEVGINSCSNREYHSDPSYLSSSQLKTLLEDREKFFNQVILGNKVNEQKSVYDIGSLVHSMLLEPHLVSEEFAFFGGWRKSGKDWERFLEQPENQGKIYISAPQKEQAEALVKAAKARPEFMHFLKGGFPEQSICTTLLDVPVKMRADYINIDQGYIFDVKTTGYIADIEVFKQTMEDFGYALSGALYCMIAEDYYKRPFTFYLGVISKSDLQADVYKMSEKTRHAGNDKVKLALETYKKCKASGLWLNEPVEAAQTAAEGPYEIKEV